MASCDAGLFRSGVTIQCPAGLICDASQPTFMLSYWGRDRKRGRLPLEFLVRKQTLDTAACYGLTDRGVLAAGKKADIKMGDTPTVLYLLRGVTDDPSAEHWGGSFVRPEPDRRPTYWHDDTRPDMADRRKPGARTVNRWRVDFLRDWQDRQKRSQQPGPGSR